MKHGIALDEGAATFSVDGRGRDQARRVVVSGGTIVITGTRFTVEQRADGGRVELHEGAIRFLSAEHAPIDLTPGASLAWPLPPVAPAEATSPPPSSGAAVTARAIEPKSAAPSPSSRRAPGPSDDDALERIEALRSRGRYDEAAALASSVAASDVKARERLSFERGSILTYQVKDRVAACAHWSTHSAAFGAGLYANEVARAKRSIGCP